MIEILEVSKDFESKSVLKNVSLKINKGSIFGIIGPNGAGKSTLMRALVGIYNIDHGEIRINGEEVFNNSEIKKLIGYVEDENSFFSTFRVKDVIKYYSLAYESFDIKRYNSLNEIFQISEKAYIFRLSKGMKMRLSLMLNLSINAEILILDEPMNGLDPIIKRKLINILLDEVAERETTIIMSSHNLMELERICDSIAIINNGEIKYTNSIEEMKRNIKKLQVVFEKEIDEDVLKYEDIDAITKVGRVYNLVTKEYSNQLLENLKKLNPIFIEEIDLSLEDMFIYALGEEENYA
ncbi:MAG: ABC transporter ATP-binding protein [Clostridiaceae bacterium]